MSQAERSAIRLSRRQLLLGSAGAATAAAFLANEIPKIKNGIETENGIFIPLYENHVHGIKPEHIPSNTDIFFNETADWPQIRPDFFLPAILPKEILAVLASQNTEIMVGDAETFFSSPYWEKVLLQSSIGAGLICAGWATYRYSKTNENSQTKKLTRKKFVNNASKVFLLWSATPLLFDLPALALSFQDNMALRRLSSRPAALTQHLHPETVEVFFRSLVMADKLLEVARDFQQATGRKARIAFNVGLGHANIEDFLLAGQDFCRKLILAHPDFFLKDAIGRNGGIRNFATARLFKMPTGLKAEDFSGTSPTSPEQIQKLDEITDRHVTDQRLVESLDSRFSNF